METVKRSSVTSSGEAMLTSDKHEKGSYVDSSTSAAPMNMVKPNKTRVKNFPPTPPPRSVSFSNDPDIEFESSLNVPTDTNLDRLVISPTDSINLNGLMLSPVDSIDINVCELPQDILVALLDRDTEMRDLFVRNQDFFDTVKISIFGEDDEKWEAFLKVLYSKREETPDSEWMNSISEYLSPNPPFLVKFKQIIGFYEDDDDNTNSSVHEENEVSYSESMNDDVWIDISPLRDVVENLEGNYSQFFINVRETLGEEKWQPKSSLLGGNYICNDNPLLHPNVESEDSSETVYEKFQRILFAPRSEIDDTVWSNALYECLDDYPLIIEQFEEIIKYEIENLQ